MNIKKNCLFIISVFCFLEGFARYGYIVFPYEDHQRYGHTKGMSPGHFTMRINGRSAIGELFRGQKIQLAFFGTSALFDISAPIEKTWSELLSTFSNRKIHVDNFSFFGDTANTLEKKLEALCSLKRFYDISIIQLSFTISDEINTPGYDYRYKPEQTKGIQIYKQIKRSYNRNYDKNKLIFSSFFQKPPDYLVYNLKEMIALKKTSKTLLQSVFANDDVKINAKEKEKEKEKLAFFISRIIDKASCISKTIFWITDPIAYSENMLKSYDSLKSLYKEKPYVLYKNEFRDYESAYLDKEDRINSEISHHAFMGYESIGRYRIEQKEIVKNILSKKRNIIFIDLLKLLQLELSKEPNLFIDIYHPSERGNELIFKLMLPKFLEYIPELKQMSYYNSFFKKGRS